MWLSRLAVLAFSIFGKIYAFLNSHILEWNKIFSFVVLQAALCICNQQATNHQLGLELTYCAYHPVEQVNPRLHTPSWTMKISITYCSRFSRWRSLMLQDFLHILTGAPRAISRFAISFTSLHTRDGLFPRPGRVKLLELSHYFRWWPLLFYLPATFFSLKRTRQLRASGNEY